MAERKPLFMQTEGYSEEMAVSDTATFGGLTLGGNIAMGTHLITGMGDPVSSQDAATKAYVDSVAQGLETKQPVNVLQFAEWDGRANVKAVSDTNIATLSGLATTVDGVLLDTDGFRVLLTNQTTTTQNGIWVVHSGSWTRPTDFATGFDAASAWIQVDAGGTSYGSTYWWCSNTSPALVDTANLTIVRALYGLATTIDGVAVNTDGLRILITDTNGLLVSSGIWVAHSGVWTRSTDMAAGTHANHAFCFVADGTLYADTGWVCVTNSPTDVVGTDGLKWLQFSSAGVIDAGAGLQKVGNIISVKKGDGIEVVSNGAATNIDLTTYPGLALSGTSPNKKLTALVSSTGGIQIDTSNGLALLLNGTTLQTGVSGVSVKGLPSSFEINGLATSYATPGTGQVTAANLNTLTAGASSNADALHTHALQTVPYAGRIEGSYAVVEAVATGDPVYQSTTNDQVGVSDCGNDAKSRVLGVARTGQSTPGNAASIVTAGPCAGVLTGATAGTPYYLAAGGGLTSTVPGAGRRVIQVGVAKNTTDLFVRIVDYGKKAA